MSLAPKIITFLQGLRIKSRVPRDIETLNPYKDPSTLELCRVFYNKYYDDDRPRTLLLGINPGRFGSGTTGISFTDPIRLEKFCGIANDIPKKPELSSDFIYRVIEAYGGTKAFYNHFLISAASPLGFTRDGKNINYYDVPELQKAVTPFIIGSIDQLIELGMNRERCFCIGEGENFKFLKTLNAKHKWFDEIIPLAHPRFIMQYRRKLLNTYIDNYLQELAKSHQ